MRLHAVDGPGGRPGRAARIAQKGARSRHAIGLSSSNPTKRLRWNRRRSMKMNSTLTAPPITAFAASQARTMHAIVQDKYGSFSALELRHIDKPTMGDADVFIRFQAASVHIGDLYFMTGLPFILRI